MARRIRAVLVGLLAVLALVGFTACGSSSSTSSDTKTTEPAGSAADSTTAPGSDDSTPDPGSVDPCSLFSVEDMKAQMGADDVTTDSSTIISPKCTYTSEAHYLEAELSVLTRDQFDSSPRDPQKLVENQPNLKIELLDVSGIGDEVFGYTMHGGVSLTTRVGDTGYSVLLTNAGGGDDAGNWVDDAAMVASAEAILKAVVSGA